MLCSIHVYVKKTAFNKETFKTNKNAQSLYKSLLFKVFFGKMAFLRKRQYVEHNESKKNCLFLFCAMNAW